MATVYIPALLRDLTSGQDVITVPGATVRQIIDQLDEKFPGMKARLCDGHTLRTGMAVAVDSHVASRGLLTPVQDDSELHFLPAIGGGAK